VGSPDQSAKAPRSGVPSGAELGGVELSGTAATIADRAAELFARKGFSSTSIREIAEAANVTKPMLYYYFGNKKGLIRHLMTAAMGVSHASMADLQPDTPLQPALQHLTEQHLRFADEHPAIVSLMARVDVAPPKEIADIDLEPARQASHAAMRGLFERAIARGELGGSADPVLLAMNYAGSLMMHIMVRITRPALFPGTAHETATRLVTLFLDGARPRPSTSELS
jgi:TetR/AcrR family transcriptional regulator